MQRVKVQPLVGELRSHREQGQNKAKQKTRGKKKAHLFYNTEEIPTTTDYIA